VGIRCCNSEPRQYDSAARQYYCPTCNREGEADKCDSLECCPALKKMVVNAMQNMCQCVKK
jgi:hypothetical protein